MKQQLALLLCLLLLVSNVMANDKTTLIVPQALDILSVNGEKYRGSIFSLGPKELELVGSDHQLVVQYNTIWELDADNHERITSEPLYLSVSLLAGKTYQVKLPAILEVAEAEAFIESPSLLLVDRKAGEERQIKLSFQPHAVAGELSPASAEQPLEQLRHWWGKATQAQREKFMAEIISGR